MLLRPGASRSLCRGLTNTAKPTNHSLRPFNGRVQYLHARSAARLAALPNKAPIHRPQLLPVLRGKPFTTALICRAASTNADGSATDKQLAQETTIDLVPEDLLGSTSKTKNGVPAELPEPDPIEDLMSDWRIFLEITSLREVPRDAYYIGLAGVMPYVGIAITTVYSALELEHQYSTGSYWLMEQAQVEHFLSILQPLQIGYGAMIISFLGAVHWGMEWARFGNMSSINRYVTGVVAPAVAWPTLFLTPELALTAQFFIFVCLYNTDAWATQKGRAPRWYAMYRFSLTVIVGISIFITLMAWGRIGDVLHPHMSGMERMYTFLQHQRDTAIPWDSDGEYENWEEKEAEKRKEAKRKAAEADEAGEADE